MFQLFSLYLEKWQGFDRVPSIRGAGGTATSYGHIRLSSSLHKEMTDRSLLRCIPRSTSMATFSASVVHGSKAPP